MNTSHVIKWAAILYVASVVGACAGERKIESASMAVPSVAEAPASQPSGTLTMVRRVGVLGDIVPKAGDKMWRGIAPTEVDHILEAWRKYTVYVEDSVNQTTSDGAFHFVSDAPPIVRIDGPDGTYRQTHGEPKPWPTPLSLHPLIATVSNDHRAKTVYIQLTWDPKGGVQTWVPGVRTDFNASWEWEMTAKPVDESSRP